MGHRRSFQAQHTLVSMTVPSGNSVLTDSEGCLWFLPYLTRCCAGLAWFFSDAGSKNPPPLNCFLFLPLSVDPTSCQVSHLSHGGKTAAYIVSLCVVPAQAVFPFLRSHASHSLPGTFYLFIYFEPSVNVDVFSIFTYFFWRFCETCGNLVPWPEIEPMSTAVEARSQPLDHQRRPTLPLTFAFWLSGICPDCLILASG